LVLDLSIAHDRFGSSSHVQQNGCLSHPQDLDAPLRIAAQRRCLSHCKECGGEGICQHQRQRSKCKECGGARICRFFARTLLNPKSLFAQEGRRIYRRSRRIYWRRSLPRSPLLDPSSSSESLHRRAVGLRLPSLRVVCARHVQRCGTTARAHSLASRAPWLHLSELCTCSCGRRESPCRTFCSRT